MGCSSNEVTLAWDPSPEGADVAGYILYSGTTSGAFSNSIGVGNVTWWTGRISGAGTYYFAIAAYDSTNGLSAPSEEVSYQSPTGGPIRITPLAGSPPGLTNLTLCSGYLTIRLEPSAASERGAKWRIAPHYARYGKFNVWTNTDAKIPLQNGELAIEFTSVPGFISPCPPHLSFSCDTRSNLVFHYFQTVPALPALPSLRVSRGLDLILSGVAGHSYCIQSCTTPGALDPWSALGIFTLPADGNTLVLTNAIDRTNSHARFFRAIPSSSLP